MMWFFHFTISVRIVRRVDFAERAHTHHSYTQTHEHTLTLSGRLGFYLYKIYHTQKTNLMRIFKNIYRVFLM